jgi:uncharacterized protein with PQ loop repeat
MNADSWVVVFGVVMVGFAATLTIPQWAKIRRTGSVEGVSFAATSNSIISASAWIVYCFSAHDYWMLIASSAPLPAVIATWRILRRNGATREGMTTTWIWLGVVIVAIAIYPWVSLPLSFLLVFSIAWFVAPAASLAWRSRDVSGISAVTWSLMLIEASMWLLYSLVSGLTAVAISAVVAIVGELAVLARLTRRRLPECGVCGPLGRCRCAVPQGTTPRAQAGG